MTRVGEFDPRHRRREKPIIIESDAGALEELRHCLAIDERSLEEQAAFMTPGLVDLNFLAGRQLLATVVLLYWLVERGWDEPHRP